MSKIKTFIEFGSPAYKTIEKYVRNMLATPDAEGIMRIESNQVVTKAAQDLAAQFNSYGVPPSVITKTDDVKNFAGQIANIEQQKIMQAIKKQITPKKSADIVELQTGKKIDQSKGIMGSKKALKTEAEIKAEIDKSNKENIAKIRQEIEKEKARTQRISGNLRADNMQRTQIGKPKLDEDEYDYYREILDDEENNIVMGDETREMLEAMVKEQEAEMAYMKRLYDKGALNETPAKKTPKKKTVTNLPTDSVTREYLKSVKEGKLKNVRLKDGREIKSEDDFREYIDELNEDNNFDFASGGRVGLKDGMSRRKFMKIMGGLAALPIIGKFFKAGKVVAPAAQAVKETVQQAPSYFFDLVAKIKMLGKPGMSISERQNVTIYKNYELTEDVATGDIRITKQKGDPDAPGYKEEVMEYNKGGNPTEEGMSVEQYDEATLFPDMDGKMKDIEDGIEPESIQEIVEEVGQGGGNVDQLTLEKIARGKLAGGGIATMLGE